MESNRCPVCGSKNFSCKNLEAATPEYNWCPVFVDILAKRMELREAYEKKIASDTREKK
jgi:hypothetical protein